MSTMYFLIDTYEGHNLISNNMRACQEGFTVRGESIIASKEKRVVHLNASWLNICMGFIIPRAFLIYGVFFFRDLQVQQH